MRHMTKLLIASVPLAISVLATAATAADAPASPYFQVDLSKHVTHSLYEPMLKADGSDLSNLVAGAPANETAHKTLKGVPFRLDGLILVGPGESSNGLTGEPAPVVKKVEGIPIGRKAESLNFLHATHWGAEKGAKIGAYVIHYADGTKEEIPIRYGVDVVDWWAISGRGDEVTEGQMVWTGSCEAASRQNPPVTIRLFMKTWKNPHPDREIKSFDVVTGDQPSGQGAPAPFLVALSGQ